MKLSEGQLAIDFKAKDINEHEIQLSCYRGKKVMLGFFRNVNCPFCNLRVHELTRLREQFEEKGLYMIIFFESRPELLKRSVFHQEVSPIPLIGDPKRKYYNQYGVERSTMKMLNTVFKKGNIDMVKQSKALNLPEEKDQEASQNLIPADFLIDEEQRIVKAYYGSNIRDHIPIEDIKAFAGL
ncbi:peroxiredoxin Q/BCP [Catalinimonas alkaloidigena]|uniref:redoxin domain-containing protein n=1 Tax=Catalinimonas alkaloidigena TaxID=1075417 RepID=UPI002405173E|nr:redoxin domain-containing protein [Catalinimonas alkaloidigena]MDF9798169.1 peroxiredoxin Q/BCP [Catalinimonas alkaloidigena]